MFLLSGVDYCCIIHDSYDRGYLKNASKNISFENQVHSHYENLTAPKKIETRNILIDKKSCKDLAIYFTRYHPGISIAAMLNLYYDKLIKTIENYKGKSTWRFVILH